MSFGVRSGLSSGNLYILSNLYSCFQLFRPGQTQNFLEWVSNSCGRLGFQERS